MRRRHFIALLGGATAAWPLAGHAQRSPMPVIGFLSSLRSGDAPHVLAAFHRGLNETGHFEGRTVAIEYRWADAQYDRLPAMAADLVRRRVAVIATISGTITALTAKAATKTIPIVFALGSDPVALGVVTSLGRPSGNITGATFFTAQLGLKRLELLRELVPQATRIAMLVNPNNPPSVLEGNSVRSAAQKTGQQISVITASTGGDIDRAFAEIAERRIEAILVGADPLFLNRRARLVPLAASHVVPAIYADREIAESGGLMSYGASRTDVYRQVGNYVGRILNGARIGDLPVVLPTEFELIVNLKAARTLGIKVPETILLRATDVIE